MDLNEFVTWQAEKPDTRSLEIKINPTEKMKVWVYDRELVSGQYVETVSEINLEEAKDALDRAEYERLRAKYGEGAKCQSISPPLVTNG